MRYHVNNIQFVKKTAKYTKNRVLSKNEVDLPIVGLIVVQVVKVLAMPTQLPKNRSPLRSLLVEMRIKVDVLRQSVDGSDFLLALSSVVQNVWVLMINDVSDNIAKAHIITRNIVV